MDELRQNTTMMPAIDINIIFWLKTTVSKLSLRLKRGRFAKYTNTNTNKGHLITLRPWGGNHPTSGACLFSLRATIKHLPLQIISFSPCGFKMS